MGANNITNLCEDAAAAFLIAEGLELTPAAGIRAGLSTEDRTKREVVCYASSAITEVPYEGNWSVTLRLTVYSAADDYSAAEHKAAAAEVFAKFATDTIVANLSGALDGFEAQEVVLERQEWGIVEREWFSWLEMSVNCCGKELA